MMLEQVRSLQKSEQAHSVVLQRMRSGFLFGIGKNRNINKKHAKMACIHHFK